MISINDDRTLSFVDTNILVYAFDKTNSLKSQVAATLLSELAEADTLRVSTQILQELYVTLTRKLRPACSKWEALSALEYLAAWPITTIDYAAIRSAADLADTAQISFWDALIVIAAAQSGAGILYTEDMNDGQEIRGVRICNPFAHAAKPH